ncbi:MULTISPECIES: hypothetical protein [Pseudoalteromonas]|uniref:Uncharacterized protein n=1 Tax=Pseudoalteromonas fuliginea TaxID=1872678 RepID=A0ABQ6RF24_9GAMM|nr:MULTISPECIES: hypothetical protein [Pseudoalteromonas]ALQ09117.1 hypothetical protein D172_014285 [Pseudoalteromonas sp. Bsw20308]KAA1152102.1 hypothetical protein EU509_15000 [Pseudoalteromonas fuliginea]KAA1166199.1 hypothetical protein EUZ79_14990 [Pseudoalteromonas fuliginea]KDC50726.1 hypothetical protein DO88_17225 [Pseudoalteromonas sp. S3431]GAA80765.1 hypothetical protein P20495_3284 [Pseudoalteromonas sp. BSi20495]
MPEWFESISRLLESSWVFILSPAIFVFYLRKDHLALRFVLVTAVFFFYGALINDYLKEFDSSTYIYRYVIWAFNDLAWMALIAYLGIKDKIYLWQCVIGQLVVISAPILQLFRLVDRHLWDLSYSTYIYKTLLPFINIGTVVVCYLPLVYFLSNKRNIASNEQ